MSLSNLSDGDLLRLCMGNSTIDPNCACLLSGGGPEMNTDISGPGVRISFYLQALFLGLMLARSASVDENSGALYTLVATNVAMVVTSFILGFKPEPGMSFHDAIVVFYLLALSWTAIFFCFPTYNRFRKSDTTLKVLYILHSYLIFAFLLAVLIVARTFGTTPRCNTHAVAVIFTAFPALTAGRVIALIVIGIVILVYSLLIVNDYRDIIVARYVELRKWVEKQKEPKVDTEAQAAAALNQQTVRTLTIVPRRLDDAERGYAGPGLASSFQPDEPAKDERPNRRTGKEKNKKHVEPAQPLDEGLYSTGLSGRLIFEIFVIIILWALFVMNAELLIVQNRFEGGGDGIGSNLWGFGQILPMFLVVLPFINLTKTFIRWKLHKRRHDVPVHKAHLAHEQQPLQSDFGAHGSGHGFEHGFGHGHGHGHGHGSRPVPPRWAGNEHRAGPDFMSSFFQQAGANNICPNGRQPSARISANSIHSDSLDFVPNARGKQGNIGGKSLRISSESSTSLSSASASSSSLSQTDEYTTAEDEV